MCLLPAFPHPPYSQQRVAGYLWDLQAHYPSKPAQELREPRLEAASGPSLTGPALPLPMAL